MTPYTHPTLYSKMVLGTKVSPGVLTLSGHNRELNWDVKQADGEEGESTLLKGKKAGEFQARFDMTDEEYDEDWPAFQRLIERTTNGPSPEAIAVYHPALAANHFTEVVNNGIGGVVFDGKGGCFVLVKFREFLPPKPKPPAAPAAAPSDPAAGDENAYDPNAAAKNELDGLLSEAAKP